MKVTRRPKWLMTATVFATLIAYLVLSNVQLIANSTGVKLRVPSIRVDWTGGEFEAQNLLWRPTETSAIASKFARNNNLIRKTDTLGEVKGLTRNVVRKTDPDLLNLIVKTTDKAPSIKILCMVKTMPSNFVRKAQVVKNTWGKRCDKTIFISSSPDAKLPAIGILPGQTESRKLLSRKVFAGLRYIYKYYGNQYDWFMVCDDDTYVIVENLRHFLSGKNPKDPVYFGHRFMKYTHQGYTSGGGGYVMSRVAMQRFGRDSHRHKDCNQTGTGSDLRVGQCLDKLGIMLGISTDSKGRSRFHSFNVDAHLFGPYPQWYIEYTRDADGSKVNDISDYPITFHYSAGRKMYILEFLLYHSGVWGLKKSDNNKILQ